MRSHLLRQLTICLAGAICLAGCGKPASGPAATESTTAAAPSNAKATVTTRSFGTLPNGAPVTQFTVTNASGTTVRLIDFGAIVTALEVPDRNGKLADVVLGYATLEDYLANAPHLGSTIGRYANRIGHARFTLDGNVYQLTPNDGPNTLHGGVQGFDKFLWEAVPFEKVDGAGVVMTRISPDGDQGFPGTLTVSITILLSNANELSFDYSAATDQPTVVNLTHHDYFNLAGEGSGDVLAHRLMIDADRYTPVDATLIPTGELASVAGTPLDFRTPTPIGARIRAGHPQIELGGGYDHNFVLNRQSNGLVLAARAEEPNSGRVLEVRTTEPGVQFYSANHLDGVQGNAGHAYDKYGAFCLETQHYPDSPNKPSFPTTTLLPGEKYHSHTVYAFSVRH